MANRPKGSDRFSRRDSVQKKPEERERYDRKNGALKAETQGRDATGIVHSWCVLLLRVHASTVVSAGARLCRGGAWAGCGYQGGLRLDSGVVQVAGPSRWASPASPAAALPAS